MLNINLGMTIFELSLIFCKLTKWIFAILLGFFQNRLRGGTYGKIGIWGGYNVHFGGVRAGGVAIGA